MAIARSKLIDPTKPTWIHCISRCVRRAFLCGDGNDHRRDWAVDRLRLLRACFALEVASFAVIAKHLHLACGGSPNVLPAWSVEDVVRRWLTTCPKRAPR